MSLYDSHVRKWLSLGLHLPEDVRRQSFARTLPDFALITPERERHSESDDGESLIKEITFDESIHWKTIRISDSPLGRLLFRKKPLIEFYQFQCGERYYTTAYFAGLIPSGTMDPAAIRVDGGGYKDIPGRKMVAMTKHEHTIRKLTVEDINILDAIVLQEMPVSEYADRFRKFKEVRLRQAITIDRIRMALDHLDRQYNPPRRDIGIGSAHYGEYRPTDRMDLREKI